MSLSKYLAFLMIPLVLTGCGKSTEGITVSDAYIRGLPPGQSVTAAFMTFNNALAQDCQLVGAASPIASSAEIHVHSHHNGAMSMRPVDVVKIPAGESLSFEPGGYHLMLFGLKEGLKEGDEHTMSLFFEGEGCGELKEKLNDELQGELKIVAPVQNVLNEKG